MKEKNYKNLLNYKPTRTQYWLGIILAFGLLIINGYLVLKLLNDEVPKQCPLDPNEIKLCDCFYDVKGDGTTAKGNLRYCTCYPGSRIDIKKEILNELGELQ